MVERDRGVRDDEVARAQAVEQRRGLRAEHQLGARPGRRRGGFQRLGGAESETTTLAPSARGGARSRRRPRSAQPEDEAVRPERGPGGRRRHVPVIGLEGQPAGCGAGGPEGRRGTGGGSPTAAGAGARNPAGAGVRNGVVGPGGGTRRAVGRGVRPCGSRRPGAGAPGAGVGVGDRGEGVSGSVGGDRVEAARGQVLVEEVGTMNASVVVLTFTWRPRRHTLLLEADGHPPGWTYGIRWGVGRRGAVDVQVGAPEDPSRGRGPGRSGQPQAAAAPRPPAASGGGGLHAGAEPTRIGPRRRAKRAGAFGTVPAGSLRPRTATLRDRAPSRAIAGARPSGAGIGR
jgi:hypothetical protein